MPADTSDLIAFNDIVEALEAEGIPAFVGHSGGGCATIYVGDTYVATSPYDGEDEEFYPVLIGPGTFVPGGSYGSVDELAVGPDEDEADVVVFGPENPPTIARVVETTKTYLRQAESR